MKCVTCSTVESKRWYDGNCQNCRNALYYRANKERIKARSVKWANENREKVREIASRWASNNRQIKNFDESMRRAAKSMGTPKWLSVEQREQIKKIYKNCPKGYHVDHIIPLRGKECKGLHVAWNLQYLPASENRSKGNKVKEASIE